MDFLPKDGYNTLNKRSKEVFAMGALSRWLSRFSYKHPNFSIPGLMKYIAIGNVVVYLLTLLSNGTFVQLVTFIPERIFRGEVWRLISFIFVPMDFSPLYFVLSLMLYYYLGTQLEYAWGSARFTIYYAAGVVLNILVGLLMWFSPALRGYGVVNMYYVNMSLFFAFATLYPDAQFLLFYIIPFKAKWLAWVDAVLFAFDIFSRIGQGQYLLALVPVVAILNYFLFFWDDLMDAMGRSRRRVRHQTSRQTINFKSAQRQAQERKGYLHKCAVCGVTDTDNPSMEFRYCSKCNGYYCYCIEHINSHVHVQ